MTRRSMSSMTANIATPSSDMMMSATNRVAVSMFPLAWRMT